jgi:5-methylcytosine-specific restriction endonuclease McrA
MKKDTKETILFFLIALTLLLLTMWGVSLRYARAETPVFNQPNVQYPGQWLDPLVEYRYTGPPKRDAKGKIIRSEEVKAAFMLIHPCPSTGARSGECADWYMDHVLPIACGGADAVWNLQWLHKSVKMGAMRPGFYPKDRIERKVYGAEPPIPDTENCTYVTPERTLR